MAQRLPLVSVIIPTFNREHSIGECLQSVLNQSHPALEVLVVDDGSRDGTRTVVERWQELDPRVKYLYQANAGVSAARNTGLRAASGEFIALLDSDDFWFPWKLEWQLAVLETLPHVGMVWSDMTAINDRGERLYERYLRRMYGAYRELGNRPLFSEHIRFPAPAGLKLDFIDVGFGNIYSKILHGNLVHTSTVLLRRERAERVGLFNEKFRRGGEDYGFHLRTCRQGAVALLDYPTIGYRIDCPDQLTHNRYKIDIARAFIATLQEERRENAGHLPISSGEFNRIFCEGYSWLGSELRVSGQKLESLRCLMTAISLNPACRYAWGQVVRALLPEPALRLLRYLRKRSRRPAPSPA